MEELRCGQSVSPVLLLYITRLIRSRYQECLHVQNVRHPPLETVRHWFARLYGSHLLHLALVHKVQRPDKLLVETKIVNEIIRWW